MFPVHLTGWMLGYFFKYLRCFLVRVLALLARCGLVLGTLTSPLM